jgi:hypothetical protein
VLALTVASIAPNSARWGAGDAFAGGGPVIQFESAPFSEPVTDPPQVIQLQAVVSTAINAYSVKVDYDETIIDVTAVNNIYALPGGEICAAENPDLDLGGGNLGFEVTCGGTAMGGSTGTFDLADITFDCLGSGVSPLTFTAAEVSENFTVVAASGTNTQITCTGGAPPPTATNTPTAVATATPCDGPCPTATATSAGGVRTATPTKTATPEGGTPPTEVPGGGSTPPPPPPTGGTTTPGGQPGSGNIQPPNTGSGDGTSGTTIGIIVALAVAVVGAGATGTGYALKKRRARS